MPEKIRRSRGKGWRFFEKKYYPALEWRIAYWWKKEIAHTKENKVFRLRHGYTNFDDPCTLEKKQKLEECTMNFTEPTMPDSTTIFQKMIDSFGTAGTIGISIIGGAVALGIISVLGMWGWRLSKKWLSTAK